MAPLDASSFGPGNRQARDLIYAKADLLVDPTIPPCLLAWCAHTQEYEVIFAKWADGDYSETDAHREFSEFAGNLEVYLLSTFAKLKEQQALLLRLTAARRGWLRRQVQLG